MRKKKKWKLFKKLKNHETDPKTLREVFNGLESDDSSTKKKKRSDKIWIQNR